IVGLPALLEKNGIIIFQLTMPTKVNGFSFLANDKVPFVISAKNTTATRNRFNLAHELAHILLHASVVDEIELNNNHRLIEHQANRFASAFLFPKERFLDEFYSTNIT